MNDIRKKKRTFKKTGHEVTGLKRKEEKESREWERLAEVPKTYSETGSRQMHEVKLKKKSGKKT